MTIETDQMTIETDQNQYLCDDMVAKTFIDVATQNLENRKWNKNDGILNLLCWLTVYPQEHIAMFFRQLCLFGCVITKKSDLNQQKVYCCPMYHSNDIRAWDIDRNHENYLNCCICCAFETDNNDLDSCNVNFCGHCLDHLHYVENKGCVYFTASWFFWLFMFIFVKLPLTILTFLAIILITTCTFVTLFLCGVIIVVLIIIFSPIVILGITVFSLVKCKIYQQNDLNNIHYV